MELRTFPKRGEIYLVCLDPTIGSEINKTRPALIFSNDINNKLSNTVTVIPITSNTTKIYPFEVLIPLKESGLKRPSKAKCNQIRTIDKSRLIKKVGKISTKTIAEIERAVCIHIGIFNI